ncbi:hypothetical protein Tco_0704932 [Tanacetum coccineum]|uniref:Uncharacterized protein n=1 Tax=Tanacetum coccineum TaxID=301880 RepID=A0ABQ4Y4J0_9ASTR
MILPPWCIKKLPVYSLSESEAEIGQCLEPILKIPFIFVPQAILLRTGKVNIPSASPQPVPTGKPKVPALVPTGRQNRTSQSSYFQTYTPYVPQMYYNHMKYGGVRWATAVKPSAGCSVKHIEKTETFKNFKEGKRELLDGGEELQQFNLFSISHICDKKNRVLFTDTDCLVLSKDFMLLDESMVVLRVPRKHNLYTINLNNLSPRGNLACLVAKASVDESVKWHRRMGHGEL